MNNGPAISGLPSTNSLPLRKEVAPPRADRFPPENPDWVEIVARIERGDVEAEAVLYRVFSRGLRFMIARHLGAEGLEDHVHECFLDSIMAIRRGQLRDPARLMGFARTIVRRKVAGQIRQRIEDRSRLCSMHPEWFLASGTRENPELLAIEKQRLVLARVAIACLPKRDREILTRFYIEEQSKEQICSEMNLTETQFRLVKSRTKAMLASRTCSLRGDSPAKRRTAPRTRQ